MAQTAPAPKVSFKVVHGMSVAIKGACASACLALFASWPGVSSGQEPEPTPWQQEKCRLYQEGWDKALKFFGTDDLNYNFIAQNENFIAGGCTAEPSVCAQSRQELDIANALSIDMINAGAASTFLPFRCVQL